MSDPLREQLPKRLCAIADHLDAMGGLGYVAPEERELLRRAADALAEARSRPSLDVDAENAAEPQLAYPDLEVKRNMEHDFETGMLEELQHINNLIVERREALLRESSAWTQQSIGAVFALGAAASAIWRLQRRARRTNGLTDD